MLNITSKNKFWGMLFIFIGLLLLISITPPQYIYN